MREDRAMTEGDVEAVAERVNQKLFETLGFDISTTKGRLEAQGAFRHLMFWYKYFGLFAKVGLTGIAGLAATWVWYKLTGGAPQ